MKMEKKQCTQCKKDLEISLFNLGRGQLTKCCIKCLDVCKKSRQRTKCEHARQKSKCKDCGGSQICEHNKQRSQCKDRGESQICEHNKIKSRCQGCGRSQICEHSKIISGCKDCGRSQICEHSKIRSICKDCGGCQICEHNKRRSQCKDCGGDQICEHNKRRSRCKDCGRGQVCEHNKQRSDCPTCDPLGHLAGVVRHRIYAALKNDKEMSSTEYLRCNIKTFKKHTEQQFTEGMSWENYDEWHIDHKIPLKYKKPSLEEVVQRLHYTNTKPMWARENMSKGCRYISG